MGCRQSIVCYFCGNQAKYNEKRLLVRQPLLYVKYKLLLQDNAIGYEAKFFFWSRDSSNLCL